MALQVCSMFQSDWGVSVTGYAVPVPESDDKLFAYYAIAYKNKILKYGKLKSEKKDPLNVKVFYMDRIFTSLNTILKSRPKK